MYLMIELWETVAYAEGQERSLSHNAVVSLEELNEYFLSNEDNNYEVVVLAAVTEEEAETMTPTERGLPFLEPDPDIQVVREILHASQRALMNDSGWGNMSFQKGSYDDTPSFKAALAKYKELKGE